MFEKFVDILNSKNKNVYVLLFLIILVSSLGIFFIFFIWKDMFTGKINDKSKESIKYYGGEYTKLKITEQDVISKYALNLAQMLKNGKIDDIYKLVSEKFLDYKNFDKNDLYDFLRSKKIYQEDLKVGSYIECEHYQLGRVYEVEYSTADNSIVEKILFIEKSPNNYVISFDSFINIDNTKKTIKRDGIELTIKKVKEFVSQIEIFAEFRNLTGGNIIINEKHYYEPIYLKIKGASEIMSDSSSFLAGEKQMKTSDILSPKLIFKVDRLSSGVMDSIILKDVYSEVTKEHKDIEFELR